MPAPTFSPVAGPVANDAANAPTAYSVLAQQTETNYNTWNVYAANMPSMVRPTDKWQGAAVCTAATGWAIQSGYAPRNTWARKGSGFTFVCVSLTRTGATIPASTAQDGNVSDTVVCTFVKDLWPLSRIWTNATYHSYSPINVYVDIDGRLVLSSMNSYDVPFVSGKVLIFSGLWLNRDHPVLT